MWTRYGVSLTILGPNLDPHCAFFSNIKSADIYRTWSEVWQKGLISVFASIQEYKRRQKYAPTFMKAVALGQILISYFHTLSELLLSSRCVDQKMTIIKRLQDTRTANINGAGQTVHILHAHSSFLSSLLRWVSSQLVPKSTRT